MSKHFPILVGLILMFIAIWILVTPFKPVRSFMERVDYLGYDTQLHNYILTKNIKPTAPIVIVDIDDKSIEAIGRWPWSRSTVADLVNRLRDLGAHIVVFDILFSENEKNIVDRVIERAQKNHLLTSTSLDELKNITPTFDEDAILARSISDNHSILALGFLPVKQTQNTLPPPFINLTSTEQSQLSFIKASGYISNIPSIQDAAENSGFINSYPDSDGIVRHSPLVIQYEGGLYPSLPLATVLTFLHETASLVTYSYDGQMRLEGIKIGEKIIPTDERGRVLIPFIGKSFTYPYFSAKDIMAGNADNKDFTGKIVIIGTTATSLGDLIPTAIQAPYPGVEAQATLINGLIDPSMFSFKPAWAIGANIVLTILFGLLAAIVFPHLGPRTLGIIIVALPISLFVINNQIWEYTGLVLSFLVPAILVVLIAFFNIIYGYVFETRRREHLKSMFGQYVPTKHIDAMLKSKSDYGLQGEDREMSVLFADIRHFTTISEMLTAAEIVEMLNAFFTPMTQIIFKNKGTIDKYVGDLIMAFWGAPLKDKNHAKHAIQSALDMQDKLAELRPIWKAKNLPEIHIGIGINSGMMSVGDMGSRFRRNYTVVGDAVNLASRAESLTKFYGVNIIVTHHTHQHQNNFVFRKLDKVRVKGKKKGVELYEVICTQSALTSEKKFELDLYDEALQYYFSKQWEAAISIMTQLHQAHPDTKIYEIYLERLQRYKVESVPAGWDGIYIHNEK